jgi:hypothetical protein
MFKVNRKRRTARIIRAGELVRARIESLSGVIHRHNGGGPYTWQDVTFCWRDNARYMPNSHRKATGGYFIRKLARECGVADSWNVVHRLLFWKPIGKLAEERAARVRAIMDAHEEDRKIWDSHRVGYYFPGAGVRIPPRI